MSLPPIVAPGWYPGGAGRPVVHRLAFSEMFSRTFALYRRGFAALLALGAVPAALGAATAFAVVWLYATRFLTGLVSLNPAGLAELMLASAGAAGSLRLVSERVAWPLAATSQ